MVLASSLISVEKNSVGPDMAGVPMEWDRWRGRHEMLALILIGIRGSGEKRRRRDSIEFVTSGDSSACTFIQGIPHPGCFRKRVRICLKRKDLSFSQM